MNYLLEYPAKELSSIIDCFWTIESDNHSLEILQKIVPDGYPEMIFHYKDPFQSNISGQWEIQSKGLIAGQIRNHFYLKSTGRIGMFAIKFQPWALTELFKINMSELTNKVVSNDVLPSLALQEIKQIAVCNLTFKEKVAQMEHWFKHYLFKINYIPLNNQKAVQLIIDHKGALDIKDIRDQLNISERSVERYFKKYVGLPPKFYSRIIRFASIFNMITSKPVNWQDVYFLAGYFDQSHFIKNFKEFTGEEPSKYGFDEKNMANFFLKK